MAANDAEAPAPQADAPEADAPEADAPEANAPEASVGVLGWLGFIIINLAAWGIIGVSTGIVWVLGLIICVCYTLGLMGLAVFFERRDAAKFHKFLNLLWVLAATFVFVSGMFVAVQIIGPLGASSGDDAGANGTSPTPSPAGPGPLSSLLPDNASTALREWAELRSWEAFKPDHAVFGGSIYFNGKDEDEGRSVLLRSAAGNVSVMAPTVYRGEGFVEYQSGLYFYDSSSGSDNTPILRVDAGDLDAVAVAFTLETAGIMGLFVEGSTLYIRAKYSCSCVYTDTLFRSDGTDNGTVDLRGDQCSTFCDDDNDYVSIDTTDDFNRATLWGALLVAVLPMMVLAGFVLMKKQMPGLFVNLYFGVEAAVIIVYFLITFDSQHGDPHFTNFLKWFLTAYNSLLWVKLAACSLLRVHIPNWEESREEELKSWAVAFVGVSFFVMVHVITEIPWNNGLGRWICYAALTVVQIVLSAIVSRTVPLVTGAIGLFILSWKFAFELVEATGISSSEFGTLILLAIMALQGLAIIVGAIFYAGNREKIEGTLNALLRCDRAALREMGARPFGDMARE